MTAVGVTRFARLEGPDGPVWVRGDGATWVALSAAPWHGGTPTGATFSDRDARLLAPVVPTKIVAFARTYPKHAAELGNTVPEKPLLFLKPPSAIVGPGHPIRLPDVGRIDPEGEVGLVIGRRLVDARPEEARAAVFGVTALNDVSARELQKADGVWGRAKGYDTFCPVGPVVVAGLDPSDLEVGTRVNGTTRARGRTRDMVWTPWELVSWASRIMTLEPGDLVATGTPPGVDAIAPGDAVSVWVEGVGTLDNPVVAR